MGVGVCVCAFVRVVMCVFEHLIVWVCEIVSLGAFVFVVLPHIPRVAVVVVVFAAADVCDASFSCRVTFS